MECLTCPNVAIDLLYHMSYISVGNECSSCMLIFLQSRGKLDWLGGGGKIDGNINRVDIFRYMDQFIYRDGISVIIGSIVLIDNN